jgi:hypothetical protein
MGGIDSFSTIFGAASKVASATAGLRKSYTDYQDVTSAYQQAKANYDENEQDVSDKAALDAQELQLQNQKAAQDRQNTLQRAVATQKAAFGGQGIDTTDGSGQAAILGLFKNSSDDKTYQDNLNNLKLQGINENLMATRRKNLLTLQDNYDNARDGLVKNLDQYTDYSSVTDNPEDQ